MVGIRCKGLCQSTKIGSIKLNGHYNLGQKRCSICGVFIETNMIRCPCCNYVLRTKPKHRKKLSPK